MTLTEVIKINGDILTKKAPWLDGRACLAALAEIETDFGKYNVPKYEKAFDYSARGKYGSRELWVKYGAMSACSWGPWQIMYPVAVELGYPGRPYDLTDPEVCIHWVLEYIQKRILDKGCASAPQLADGYNTGSFRDSNVPAEYVSKFLRSYTTVKDARQLW